VGTEIDAVIAALEVELQEAEQDRAFQWKAERCNRWIKQLPGGWARQWVNLKLQGYSSGFVFRTDFIMHVKATLAYLETKRPQPGTKVARWAWPFKALKRKLDQPSHGSEEPIDAEFTDVPTPSGQRKLPKPKIVK
jgi:hypothetical protein